MEETKRRKTTTTDLERVREIVEAGVEINAQRYSDGGSESGCKATLLLVSIGTADGLTKLHDQRGGRELQDRIAAETRTVSTRLRQHGRHSKRLDCDVDVT